VLFPRRHPAPRIRKVPVLDLRVGLLAQLGEELLRILQPAVTPGRYAGQRAVDAVAAQAPRVSVVLKADIRPGVTGALTAKVETVERYLRG